MAKQQENTEEKLKEQGNIITTPENDEKPNKQDKKSKIVADVFKNWPSIQELWQTADGTCFFTANAATNHARVIGGEVKKITRKS